jgi:hypothetical protein
MPTLRQLLEELRLIKVDPDDVRIPGQLYDDLVDAAEDIAEGNPVDEEDCSLVPRNSHADRLFRGQRGMMVNN